MPKYLIKANYSPEGLQGLLKDGAAKRGEVAGAAVKSVGGTLDSFYYAFGETDVYLLCDFPDNESAAAVSLAVSATGAVACNVTVLLSTDEIDAAIAKSPGYTPPGA